jgi:hypothetical protein
VFPIAAARANLRDRAISRKETAPLARVVFAVIGVAH